jgi:hypothetical protein
LRGELPAVRLIVTSAHGTRRERGAHAITPIAL